MYRTATRFLAAAVCCLLPGAIASAADDTNFEEQNGAVTVKAGEKPLVVYWYQQNPAKPYAEKLFTPGGVNVLRDSPADHKHHHGLMFAVAVDGVDFWSENPSCGQQKHLAGQDLAVFSEDGVAGAWGVQEIEWTAPGGKVLLLERRSAAFGRVDGPATVVLWKSEFRTPEGKDSAKLTGSPYFGLGMRFVASMDKEGTLFNADGKTGVAGTNNVRSAWCAYSAAAEGKPVTVAMISAASNPRPATWFTMDQGFAYVSATLNLNKEPLVIEAGKPLALRYAVAAWDGKADAAAVDKLAQRLRAWEKR